MAYRKLSNQSLSEKAALLETLKGEAATLEEQVDALRGEITAELTRRELDALEVPGYLIRWTAYSTNRLDAKALKTDHPEISEAYTKSTAARRLTVTAQ